MFRVLAAILVLALVGAHTQMKPSTFPANRLQLLRRFRGPVSEVTFDKLDANGDGSLSGEELRNAAERRQSLPSEEPVTAATLSDHATAARKKDESENFGSELAPNEQGVSNGVVNRADREAVENLDVVDELPPPGKRVHSREMKGQDLPVQDVEDDRSLPDPQADGQTSGCKWCADNDANCEQLWCSNNCRHQCEGLKAQSIFGKVSEPQNDAQRAHTLAEEGGLVTGCQWCSENDKACEQTWCTSNCPQQCGGALDGVQPQMLQLGDPSGDSRGVRSADSWKVAPTSLAKQYSTWLKTPDAVWAAQQLKAQLMTPGAMW